MKDPNPKDTFLVKERTDDFLSIHSSVVILIVKWINKNNNNRHCKKTFHPPFL